MESIEPIITADGSSSLFHKELNETYHSTRGALAESAYVFIDKGLQYLIDRGENTINIFEVGFGTGLNAILTYKHWQSNAGYSINYITIEKYPLSLETVQQLKFSGIHTNENVLNIYTKMHQMPWDEKAEIGKGFTITKIQGDIDTAILPQNINLVYYDAFAPSKQPEMWTPNILQKVKNTMVNNGVLVTYCANGQFKRNLKQLGFVLDKLKGPMGKKEMTRALLVNSLV